MRLVLAAAGYVVGAAPARHRLARLRYLDIILVCSQGVPATQIKRATYFSIVLCLCCLPVSGLVRFSRPAVVKSSGSPAKSSRSLQ